MNLGQPNNFSLPSGESDRTHCLQHMGQDTSQCWCPSILYMDLAVEMNAGVGNLCTRMVAVNTMFVFHDLSEGRGRGEICM